MVKKEIRQICVRVTNKEWKDIRFHLAENETSFQELIIKLLSENGILKK